MVNDKELLKNPVVLDKDSVFEGWVREAHFQVDEKGFRNVVVHEFPLGHLFLPTEIEENPVRIENFDFFVPFAYISPVCQKGNPVLYKTQRHVIHHVNFMAISKKQSSLGIFLGNSKNMVPLIVPVQNEEWTRLMFGFNSKEETMINVSWSQKTLQLVSKPHALHLKRKYNMIRYAS